jgi:hypothetical protein
VFGISAVVSGRLALHRELQGGVWLHPGLAVVCCAVVIACVQAGFRVNWDTAGFQRIGVSSSCPYFTSLRVQLFLTVEFAKL